MNKSEAKEIYDQFLTKKEDKDAYNFEFIYTLFIKYLNNKPTNFVGEILSMNFDQIEKIILIEMYYKSRKEDAPKNINVLKR